MTFLLLAFVGAMLAVNCCVAPIDKFTEIGLRLIPLTGMAGMAIIVITAVAVLLWSAVVTVMLTVPGAIPVTIPLELTVAIAALLEVKVTFLLLAFVGAMLAVNCCVAPIIKFAVKGLIVTALTNTWVFEPESTK